MFTGIIAAIGSIEAVKTHGGPAGVTLTIAARSLSLDDVAIGDSISINGACMTVAGKTDTHFYVDVSQESLSKTVCLDRPGEVNLEKALRMCDFLGGHLVSGHVDGFGVVMSLEPVGTSRELVVRAPSSMGKYLASKGSVAVNGVSLTINRVFDRESETEFSVNLIPHTLTATTLGKLKPEDRVNLEADLIARYAERLFATRTSTPAG
jgi:riboflavin synthase